MTLTLIVSAIFIAFMFKQQNENGEIAIRILTTLVASLTFYSFLITVPTLLDRSISIFLLAELQADPDQTMTQGALNDAFLDGYVNGSFQVQKRITEQISIGNFQLTQSGDIELTRRGELVALLNRFLATVFKVDPRYTSR